MELGARVRFDYALVASKLPEIFHALGITLYTWILGLVGACALGFVVAVSRRYGPRPLDLALGAYVELFRGTPFLIQLFLLYFGGPYAGLSLDAIPAGLLGLSVYGAAYFSEIFRGGATRPCRGGRMRRPEPRADHTSHSAAGNDDAGAAGIGQHGDHPDERDGGAVGRHRSRVDADHQRHRHRVLRLRRMSVPAGVVLLGSDRNLQLARAHRRSAA